MSGPVTVVAMPGSGSEVQRAAARRRSDAVARRATRALDGVAGDGATVVVVGVRQVGADAWAVLAEAGLSVVAVDDVPEALRAVARHSAQVVIADVPRGRALVRALRRDPRLAAVHVVLAAPLESAARAARRTGLGRRRRHAHPVRARGARDARRDGGLRAARLRASEALLRSLVDNIPGALYRCACDLDWTMEWLSDEIEEITGYRRSDFIDKPRAHCSRASSIRTTTDYVAQSVHANPSPPGRPFALEYRLVHRDGSGSAGCSSAATPAHGGDGRWWLDGAIFDITARSRGRAGAASSGEVVDAQLAEVRASRARILEAADRARRDIERNLHDGAQQRLVVIALAAAGLARRPTASCPTRRARLGGPTPSGSCGPASPSCATSRAACTRRC